MGSNNSTFQHRSLTSNRKITKITHNNSINNNIISSNSRRPTDSSLNYISQEQQLQQQQQQQQQQQRQQRQQPSLNLNNNTLTIDSSYFRNQYYNINYSNSTSSFSSTSTPESPGWDSSTSTLNNNKKFPPFNNYNKNINMKFNTENNSSENINNNIGYITNTPIVDEPDDISDTTDSTLRHRVFPREHDNNSDETATINPSLIYNSDEFYELSEDRVISLLERDDIDITEIEIWNQLIMWGIKNTSNLSSKNFSNWDDRDFYDLKNTLKNCISFIRFFQIQPDEFAKYVWPYKKIIQKSIIGNFLRQQITGHDPIMEVDSNPPRIPSSDIDSVVMTGRHATILASWMQQGPFCGKVLFNFRLIYRASKDDISLKSFHENCVDKGPTILVIKLFNSKQIVGVYNPLSYQKSRSSLKRRSLSLYNSRRSSKRFDSNASYLNLEGSKEDTFLFSFKTRYYPEETALISRVIPEYSNESIKRNPNGLCFGTGPDLQINLDGNEKIGKAIQSSYQHPIIDSDGYFGFEEIEVFQVLRKTEYF